MAVATLRDLIDKLRHVRQTAITEPTTATASHLRRERRGSQLWPVIEYGVSRRRLWEEIWIPVVVAGASLALIFGELEPQLRARVLFLTTIGLLLLPPALKALGRALLSNYRGGVRLEDDRLIYDPGLGPTPRTIRYEQIWNVDVSKGTKMVYVKYYPAGFGDQIDEGCIAFLSVGFVQDVEGLASELGKRAYGAPPRRSVTARHTIKSLLRMFAWLLVYGVTQVETVMIFSILSALKYL